MNQPPASAERPRSSYRGLLLAGAVGLMVGFFSVALQMHHDLHWPGILACAPVDLLGHALIGLNEPYLWFKILGTGPLYAFYAWLYQRPSNRQWRIAIAAHACCALVLFAMPVIENR